ncbi:hypothetical protein [Streptomyces sp. NPDC006193]|uniref:hypothetical protein n=1 Tax=Streptomyces sp. NPDC006193 TaxID=3155717 RepID=UPI0033AB88D8
MLKDLHATIAALLVAHSCNVGNLARLSPFARRHFNMLGRYFFQLPDLPGGLRPLRDPDATDEE